MGSISPSIEHRCDCQEKPSLHPQHPGRAPAVWACVLEQLQSSSSCLNLYGLSSWAASLSLSFPHL